MTSKTRSKKATQVLSPLLEYLGFALRTDMLPERWLPCWEETQSMRRGSMWMG